MADLELPDSACVLGNEAKPVARDLPLSALPEALPLDDLVSLAMMGLNL